MGKGNIKLKGALKQAWLDTLQVVFWSGVPATGVIGLLAVIQEDIPTIARYAPYIATLVNTVAFFIKRLFEYKLGKRKGEHLK